MKNLIIFSFPRSGTHFLMNSISANFNHYSVKRMKIPITDNIGKITEFFQSQCLTNRMFKSHMQSYSLINVWNNLLNDYYIFYVIREGKDAITSLYNFYKMRDKKTKQGTCGDFIRNISPDTESAFKVAIKKPTTVLDMWEFNIYSWLGKPHVFYVFYEDLINKFDDVVRAIGKHINMTPPKTIIKPSKKINVLSPGPGIIGNYKKHFLDEDVLYFDHKTIQTRALIEFNRSYLRY